MELQNFTGVVPSDDINLALNIILVQRPKWAHGGNHLHISS